MAILDKLDGRGLKGWQAAELQYLKGKIYLESGEAAKADTAFDLFVKTNRESKDYWLPHAIFGRGQAALNLGRGSSAQQHFKGLIKMRNIYEVKKINKKLTSLTILLGGSVFFISV